jgi:hypothetical protein
MPLGPAGMMFVKPGTKDDDPVIVANSGKHGLNVCRVVALPGERESDLIVCAGRRGGIAFVEFREGVHGLLLHTVRFDALDIVDVCSLGNQEHPQAFVAASRDGSLVLFRDIKTNAKPIALKFKRVKGAVYRVLSAGGDIYLLTSTGLYILVQLAARFHKSVVLEDLTRYILKVPIEAADANIVDQKWLLAPGVDDLFRFDVRTRPKSPDESSNGVGTQPTLSDALWGEQSPPEGLNLLPLWEESAFEQSSIVMTSVG